MRFLIIFFSVFIFINLSAQRDTSIQNWTFGAEKGMVQIQGEVDAKSGFAFGFFAEKNIHPLFSIKLQGGMGSMQGQNLKPSTNWLNNPVWNGKTNATINYNNASTNSIYNNFETNYMEGSLQGVFNFTQLSFFKNKSKFDGFLLAGIGVMQYEAKVDAADLEGNIYDFSGLDSEDENRILPNLNSILDGDFETSFQSKPEVTPTYQAGAGIKWNFKKNITLALSHRVSWTGKDDLDAHQWNEKNELDNVNDLLHFTSLSLSYTFFKTKKIDEPKPVEVPFVGPGSDLIEEPDIIEVEEPEVVEPEPEPKEPEEVILTVEEEEVVKRAFDNLEFETSRAVISTNSFSSLNELAILLSNHPTWKLTIKGHTDDVGSAENNMNLSKQRAEAVANYLSSRGISNSRLIVSWFGEEQPIADNTTAVGRQKNRRVEMEIVE